MILRTISLLLLLAVISACTDEHSVSDETLRSNFCVPSDQLLIKESFFNCDLNICTIFLKESPPASFYSALESMGWEPRIRKETKEKYYTKGQSALFLDKENNAIIIRSRLYDKE